MPQTDFERAMRAFFARDYKADVALLNRGLAKRGHPDAGLVEAPPSILTGDPFSLEPGNCMVVIGINPKWSDTDKQKAVDARPAEAAWAQGFDAYRHHRASYFSDGDPRYNGRHFSRLGNAITGGFLGRAGDNARKNALEFFGRQAAIFDLLPYWSKKADSLDLGRVDPASDGPIRQWYTVLQSFFAEKRPRAIVINTSGFRSLVENMLGCRLDLMPECNVYAGHAEITQDRVPIFMHAQLSSRGGMSHQQYREASACWAKRVGLTLPLFQMRDV